MRLAAAERRDDMIVTKRREEIPHPNKWEGVEAGSKMRTSKGKRTFVILEITVRAPRRQTANREPHAPLGCLRFHARFEITLECVFFSE